MKGSSQWCSENVWSLEIYKILENTPVMESFSYSCAGIDVPFYNLQLLFKVILCVSDAYLELCSTSVMELFCGNS